VGLCKVCEKVMVGLRLDAVDVRVLEMIQRDSKPSTMEMAKVLGVPVTTVYSKIRRLEKEGVIRGYRAVLDGRKLGRGVVAFVLASVSYGAQRYDKDRAVARQLSKFSEVQEVHLVSGPWDFINSGRVMWKVREGFLQRSCVPLRRLIGRKHAWFLTRRRRPLRSNYPEPARTN